MEIDAIDGIEQENGEGTKNLNTYRALFWVKGGLNCLFILVGWFYAAMGPVLGAEIKRDLAQQGRVMESDPTDLLVGVGVTFIILGAVLAILAFIAAVKINRRESRTFIIVAAALNCPTGILGILLCIFTIIELQKKEVKAVFKS